MINYIKVMMTLFAVAIPSILTAAAIQGFSRKWADILGYSGMGCIAMAGIMAMVYVLVRIWELE